MPRAPSISVCNIALSEIRAPSIVSLDEGSPEANACAIHYDDCLQTLLEYHDWGFARIRTTLAALDVNDRTEWQYAYALPDDCAGTVSLVWGQQLPISGVFYPWPYTFPRPPGFMSGYAIDSGTIYSNLLSPQIEYISRDVEEEKMPAAFKRALALDLASRLVIPLLNDRAMKGDFIQQAEAAKRRAMADDFNRYPRRDVQGIDEVAWVRA